MVSTFLPHIHCRVNGSDFCHFIPTLDQFGKTFQLSNLSSPLRRAGCDRHYGCAFSPNAVLISRAVSDQCSPLLTKRSSVSLMQGPEYGDSDNATYIIVLKDAIQTYNMLFFIYGIAQFTRLFQVFSKVGISKRSWRNCGKPVCRMMLINSSSASG